jgi:membrane-bound lytic murein transglycosylase D
MNRLIFMSFCRTISDMLIDIIQKKMQEGTVDLTVKTPRIPHGLTLLGLCLAGIFFVSTAQAEPNRNDTLAQIAATTLPVANTDLWSRVRDGFVMEEVSPALVRTHERWFASHPEHLARTADRSRPYLYHVVEEVAKRGMPMEAALLPFIESSYNPAATSPRAAAGMWQFIPSTGRAYGLKQDGWVDNRRDVAAATDAALDYLQKLHAQFGRWDLAFAAYNCGEGCVARVLKKNTRLGKPLDYASLPLPTETRHYVPKLIALRNIVREPERFRVQLAPIDNEAYFMQVTLKQPMSADTAARLAEMSMSEFAQLNPGLKRHVIGGQTASTLLIPADRVEAFHFNLQQAGKTESSLKAITPGKGDTMAKIAERFGVPLQWLRDHNVVKTTRKGGLSDAQTVLVPVSPAAVAPIKTDRKKHDLRASLSNRRPL